MNVKTEIDGKLVRRLRTDEEVLVEATSSPDRVRATKALMRSKCTLLVPEMLMVITEIARSDENTKVRLDAAKYIVDRGLGLVDKETTPITKRVEEAITNAELEAVLVNSNKDLSD